MTTHINRRRFALAAAATSLLPLSACVHTQVTSRPMGAGVAPATRLLVVVQPGKFDKGNLASSLGQKNLDSLHPHLMARLPLIFTRNALPSRAVEGAAAGTVAALKPEPGEHMLLLRPYSATYNSSSGQELFLNAQLLAAAAPHLPVWQAQIRLATMGFGKFDDAVASEVALKLLTQMREDRAATLPAGAFTLV